MWRPTRSCAPAGSRAAQQSTPARRRSQGTGCVRAPPGRCPGGRGLRPSPARPATRPAGVPTPNTDQNAPGTRKPSATRPGLTSSAKQDGSAGAGSGSLRSPPCGPAGCADKPARRRRGPMRGGADPRGISAIRQRRHSPQCRRRVGRTTPIPEATGRCFSRTNRTRPGKPASRASARAARSTRLSASAARPVPKGPLMVNDRSSASLARSTSPQSAKTTRLSSKW